jgi:type II secretory pathway pseudopilin PulG
LKPDTKGPNGVLWVQNKKEEQGRGMAIRAYDGYRTQLTQFHLFCELLQAKKAITCTDNEWPQKLTDEW